MNNVNTNEVNMNDVNRERSWLWRKIGFWFVPVRAETLGPEEWAKVRKMSRTGKRRTRRLLFGLVWGPVLVCEIGVWLRVVRLHPWAGLMGPAWLPVLLGLWVRSLR